ncbi:MAG: hypothetical protein DWQ19_10565 [Crenarchaeota archaeon]|nr:MAG: hypothetical protein DWQ19_10565 [Thermoproteota archaeon]
MKDNFYFIVESAREYHTKEMSQICADVQRVLDNYGIKLRGYSSSCVDLLTLSPMKSAPDWQKSADHLSKGSSR